MRLDDAFTFATAGLLVVTLTLLVLTYRWPDTFGWAMLVYGLVLLAPALVLLIPSLSGLWLVRRLEPARGINWTFARWLVMLMLQGLACVLAYLSFVVFPPLRENPRKGNHGGVEFLNWPPGKRTLASKGEK